MSAHFFETSARSAIGLVRQGNEDSGFVSSQLIAVADGMGGHAAGEVASRIAIEVLQSLAPALISADVDEDSVEDLLMHSLHSIDSEISVVTDEEIEKQTEMIDRNLQTMFLLNPELKEEYNNFKERLKKEFQEDF